MGATVRQVRRGDRRVELDARVDMALAWDPDLFVSLHHNAVGGGEDPLEASGSKVFLSLRAQQGAGPGDCRPPRSALTESTPDVLPQVFRVNRNVSLCPSVLVETAFISNPRDEARLRKTETIKADARAIAEAIRDYMQAKD
jgi:N-acetylmuramoyl-L-alanine amidase